MSSSCWRRWAPVIRTRGRPALLVMAPIVPRPLPGPAPSVRGAGRRGPPSGGRRGAAHGRPPDRVGPLHVPRPAQLLEHPDGPGADVDLTAEHAVAGAGR